MRPQIRLTKVVLPAPFGPMMARISPGIEVEVDAVDGARPPKIAAEACVVEQRRHGSHGSPALADGAEDAVREEEHEQRPARRRRSSR